MGISNFLVKLDDPDATYSPGSTVSGTVQLTVSGEEATYAIRVKLSGSAATKKILFVIWPSHRYYYGERHNFYGGPHYCDDFHHYSHRHSPSMYRARQKLVQFNKLLFGDDTKPETIPVGENSFPFSFQLPAKPLPPSYEINSLNFITYKLGAYIVMPWYRRDIRTEIRRLRVVTPYKLNQAPWAKIRSSMEDSKRFGLLWWKKGPLILKATINPSGYCLGDEIPVTVEIDNKSDRDLKDVTVQLIREWKLTAGAMGDYWDVWHEAWAETEAVKIVHRGEGVPAASKANWDARLMIPPNELPSMSDITCDIIKMSYNLRVTACVDAMLSWNLYVDLPVTIGTTPFT